MVVEDLLEGRVVGTGAAEVVEVLLAKREEVVDVSNWAEDGAVEVGIARTVGVEVLRLKRVAEEAGIVPEEDH